MRSDFVKILNLTVDTNGKYYAPIDITVDEWKDMLCNPTIFDANSLDVILKWYKEPNHKASNSYIQNKYFPHLKSVRYNGIIRGLGIRIIKYLNRFEVLQTTGTGNSYFIIPFEGWKDGSHFVWKLRTELAQAIRTSSLINGLYSDAEDDLLSIVQTNTREGRKISYYTTKYERNVKYRDAAIQIHGTICMACGFNFARTYGELGKDYIEVHHTTPLYTLDEETTIDPAHDLACLCANCHRMIHRKRDNILTVQQLKSIIQNQGI